MSCFTAVLAIKGESSATRLQRTVADLSVVLMQVREFVENTGIENLGKRLVNSREGKVEFEKPNMTLETLLKCVSACSPVMLLCQAAALLYRVAC